MEGIYEWIRNLVFYLILMTMILNLLPDRKYEKYLRLFTGMIFILLVFRPFADLAGLEERMAGAFEKITFQNDVKLLKRELEEADGERLLRLADGYREAVELDLRTMAEGIGVECRSVSAVMESDPDSGEFGTVRSVELLVAVKGAGAPPSQEVVPGGDKAGQEARLRANREIVGLKKKIGEYYGLEEANIQIRLENE